MTVDRQEEMDKEFSKTPGGNYFNYVDTAKLERLGITQFKPVLGENAIRIVFPPDRPGFYGLEIRRHSNVGVNRKTFLCRREMFNEECPICSFAEALRKDDPQDERAKTLYAGRRYLFFVVEVLSEDTMKRGIRWFDCPIGIYKEIKSRSKNKRRGTAQEGTEFKKYTDVSHPVDGKDIEFEQVKQSGKYDYEGVRLVDADPIPKDWYNDLPEFKEILKESSIEEINEALNGETTPDEEIDEEIEREVKDNDVKEETQEENTSGPEEEKQSSNNEVSTRGVNSSRKTANKETSDIRARVRDRLDQSRKARQVEEEDGK